MNLDVDRLVVEVGLDDDREEKTLRVRSRESGVPVAAPLHRSAHAVAVADVDVVPHADLVPVIDDRRPDEREEEAVQQLDAPPVVPEQRCQPSPDAEVDPRPRIVGVDPVHVIALLVGDHFESELVVIPQKNGPLGALRDRGRLGQDVQDRVPVFHAQRHEEARHEREVERHVAFVPLSEVGDRVLGPLIRLGEEHAVRVVLVDVSPEGAQLGVRRLEVLARRPFLLVKVGDGVQAQPVHSHREPVIEDVVERAPDRGVFEVEIGLVAVEAVPVMRLRDGVPGPVGVLEVLEDDPRVAIPVDGVAPDVEVAVLRSRRRVAGSLEPRVLVGRVVDDQLGDHLQTPAVSLFQEVTEVRRRSVVRMDPEIVRNVVAVVAQR